MSVLPLRTSKNPPGTEKTILPFEPKNRLKRAARPADGAGGPLSVGAISEQFVINNETIPKASLAIDQLPDWALNSHPTAQITLCKHATPCMLTLLRGVRLAAQDDQAILRLKAANHRADAQLILRPIGDNAGDQSVTLDRAFPGGPTPDRYQNVAFNLAKTGHYALILSVSNWVDDGSGLDPFVFLADLRTVSKPHDRAGQKPNLSLRQAPDQSLVVRADAQVQANVHLDGTHVSTLSLSPGETTIPLPARAMDNAAHRIALTDALGTPMAMLDAVLPSVVTPLSLRQVEATPPRIPQTAPQSQYRYAALKAQITRMNAVQAPGTEFAQISHALATVEQGHSNVRLEPISFPECLDPKVSVIIPAHNQISATYLALCALLLAPNKTEYEVIVVDDGSSDETRDIADFVSGIRVLRHDSPERFIRACNRGAEMARGDYLVFLNNDTEVTTGWIDALVAGFDRGDSKVGATGARLIAPDGRLTEAGGIVWDSGNPWNYGRGENPYDPRFSYARRVDYLSGAALMVDRRAWDIVGGFSRYLDPMYFEDTDLAFKLRDTGFECWYIPAATVFHWEGVTAGRSEASGLKAYQAVNRPKFQRRWAAALAGQPPEHCNPDLAKDRDSVGRILFVDETTPRPDMDAGSYAAVQEMRLVQSMGYKVSFLPRNMAHMGGYSEALQDQGIELIHAPFFHSPADVLRQRGGEFDAIYLTRHYVARDILDPIQTYAPKARILFNNADLHFLREFRAALVQGDDTLTAQARQTRDQEIAVMRRADLILSYNPAEHPLIETSTEGAVPVMTCPWVVAPISESPGTARRTGLSFLGGFQHRPNGEGITWFARDVMPGLCADLPGLALYIYGSRMTDDIRALASPAIHPVGYLPEIRRGFDPHRIFIAPLLSGAGIKGKVLAAMAHGIPCVLSPVAAEGIGLRHGQDCLIAQTPDDWRNAIHQLCVDDQKWDAMRRAAQSYLDQAFSFDRGRDRMRAAFTRIGLPHAGL